MLSEIRFLLEGRISVCKLYFRNHASLVSFPNKNIDTFFLEKAFKFARKSPITSII